MSDKEFDFNYLKQACEDAGCIYALEAYLDVLGSNVSSATKAYIRNKIDDATGLDIEFIQTVCENRVWGDRLSPLSKNYFQT